MPLLTVKIARPKRVPAQARGPNRLFFDVTSICQRLFILTTSPRRGMVQKGPFSGNTWDLSAHSERSRAGAGFGESLVAAPGLQFWENRVYPRSSSQ